MTSRAAEGREGGRGGRGTATSTYGSVDIASSSEAEEATNNDDDDYGRSSADETSPLVVTAAPASSAADDDAGDLGNGHESFAATGPAPPSGTSNSKRPLPRPSPSLYSRLVFSWFHPLLELGNRKSQLDPSDLDALPLPLDCTTEYCMDVFDEHWEREVRRAEGLTARKRRAAAAKHAAAVRADAGAGAGARSKAGAAGAETSRASESAAAAAALQTAPDAALETLDSTTVPIAPIPPVRPSLTRTLLRSYGPEFAYAGILKLIHDLCIFVGPQVLNGLIYFLRDPDAPLSRGLGLTLAVTLSQLTMSFCLRHYFYRCYLTGLRVRTSVVMAVYRKALKLSSAERQLRTAGEIVNLMSVDAQRMQDLTTYLHAVWYSFVQIGLAIYFLWQQLGPSCLGGVAIIIIMMPVTRTVARWMGGMQKKLMAAKDARVEVNNEVLGSMKVIKLQAWEDPFQTRILALRDEELRRLYKYVVGNSLSIMLWSAVPLLVAVTTFAAYTISGNELDVASALTALALFEILRFPLFMLPQIVNRIVEASVSVGRVRSFLLCREHRPPGPDGVPNDEVEDDVDGNMGGDRCGGCEDVRMEDATFVYEAKKPKFEYDRYNLSYGGNKNRRRPGTGVREVLSRELHDSRWEVALLKSQLADAEGRIRTLLRKEQRRQKQTIRESSPSVNNGGNPLDATESTMPIMEAEDLYPPDDLLSLKRINFTCRRGEFIAVVGHVGSGKSTFLNAILGEVKLVHGTLGVGADKNKLAHFPQTPFVMNDTVRDNVVFGHRDEPFDGEKYRRAISTCALTHDLELLPDGDMTEIGERGITLSGGQKARVAMARAVYHDADMYLLDDPLAAVDAHVGRHLFQRCIVEEMLLGGGGGGKGGAGAKGKRKSTVIIATNALQYLSHPTVDRIVVLKDGRVEERGTYAELSGNPGSLFASFLAVMAETGGGAYADTDAGAAEDDTDGAAESMNDGGPLRISSLTSLSAINDVDEPEVSRILVPKKKLPSSPGANKRIPTERQQHQNADILRGGSSPQGQSKADGGGNNAAAATAASAEQPSSSKPLMTDEIQEREVGHVGLSVYLAWARAAGGAWVGVAIILAFGAVEGINVLSKWWLTHWSQQGGTDRTSQMKFLAVYALINLTAVAATFGRLLLVMLSGLRASEKIYARLLDVVLRAPMSFFDTTPIGRIINRFSKDMYTVDEQLVSTLRSYLSSLTTVVGVIFVVSAITPIFTLCLVPIMIYYVLQQRYFTCTYRELKRMDSVQRSPIYALLGETLDGVSTIRAFAAQPTLLNRIVSMLDKQQNAYYLTCTAQCWLAVRLELAGTLIISFASLCAVFEHSTQGGNEAFAALAGLSISFALSVTQSLNWSVRMGSDLEGNFVAVERIEQYTKISIEAPREVSRDRSVGSDWPSNGLIEFSNAKLRYRPGLPLVLKGLNLQIPARSKVGVVGRTGAGKSTLMVALLRIVELDEGTISIDGVDIETLGLKKLRSKIAVIPQDPVLFSGTVRTNLDPFSEYSDERLYEVLLRVGLMTSLSRPPSTTSLGALSHTTSLSGMSGTGGPSSVAKTLEDKVFEGGSNFSVGQRQLLVIARSLLCGASVVIMDEATASVDADTDARIQRVMRTEFRDSTCITVAHRINTILDSDYILCMDDGRAAEFDTPNSLLARGGLFKDLVNAWEEEHGK